jgi:hypothetical protein
MILVMNLEPYPRLGGNMPKVRNWIVNEDGINHQVEVKGYIFKNDTLSVDGEYIPIPITLRNLMVMVDVPFMIGSKQCHYIKTVENKMDLVVDGVSQSSGKAFEVNKKTPWWAWIFIASYIPLLMFGGFLPVFGATFGMLTTYSYTRTPQKKTLTKVLMTLAIEVLIWVTVFGIAIIISSLFPTD